MPPVEAPELSLTEYAVLGVLAEHPAHGFAISKALASEGEVGRVLTVRRPLTYRALDRLVEAGLAAAVHTEPGDAGPERIIHRITPAGRRQLKRWLAQPVQHIRDMRIEFQLKLTLLSRSRQSPLALVQAQRVVFQPTLAALDSTTDQPPDHVELWRQHNAAATDAYLRHLEAAYQAS
jgi:DNA-binding PadR family transcriptional regulator